MFMLDIFVDRYIKWRVCERKFELPVVKNTSADFSVSYLTQARYIRLRFNNTSGSTKIIEKSYAAYKFNKYKDKSGVITSLDSNTSYVTQ